MQKQNDFFKHKAKSYENEVARVNNVATIAHHILEKISLTKQMSIMDFGSGTGLLTKGVAPHVKKITAVDISTSMNEVLKEKEENLECELEIVQKDLTKESLVQKFDAIISSMTMHHIEDITAMFKTFYDMLPKGGKIALADIESEDGSFHTENTGVFHFGFEPKNFLASAREVGFLNAQVMRVSMIEKPQGVYPVFLFTAQK